MKGLDYRQALIFMAVLIGIVLPVTAQDQKGQPYLQEAVQFMNESENRTLERVPAGDSLSGSVDSHLWQPQQYKGPEVIRTENFSMILGARLQVRYTYSDPGQGSQNGSFAIRRARLSLSGNAYEHFRYAMQLEMAGSSVNLIDANVRYQMAPMAILWFGQGKAFFGRQQLTSSGSLNFVDRTIVDSRFSAGRQAGIALTGQNDAHTFEYNLGIYNGTGINTANDNGKYMKVARIVLTPLGAYPPVESAHDYPESMRLALGVSGLHTTTGTGTNETDITRLNVESAFKLRGLNVTGEFYWEETDSAVSGSLKTTGWYTQAGFLFPGLKNEIVVRYAAIYPDVSVNSNVIETGVSYSHYLHEHRAKIQADLRNVERKGLDTNDVEFRIQIQLSL